MTTEQFTRLTQQLDDMTLEAILKQLGEINRTLSRQGDQLDQIVERINRLGGGTK